MYRFDAMKLTKRLLTPLLAFNLIAQKATSIANPSINHYRNKMFNSIRYSFDSKCGINFGTYIIENLFIV